jgi:hypothetical protein
MSTAAMNSCGCTVDALADGTSNLHTGDTCLSVYKTQLEMLVCCRNIMHWNKSRDGGLTWLMLEFLQIINTRVELGREGTIGKQTSNP